MTTKPEGDELTVTQVQRIDNPATTEATHNADLDDSSQHQHQLEVLNLFGTVDYDENYDYKKNRQLDSIE